MSLAKAIVAAYPGAVSLKNFLLQDDGAGPFLAKWDEGELGPKPDAATLQTLADGYVPPPPPKTVYTRLAEIEAKVAALEAKP